MPRETSQKLRYRSDIGALALPFVALLVREAEANVQFWDALRLRQRKYMKWVVSIVFGAFKEKALSSKACDPIQPHN